MQGFKMVTRYVGRTRLVRFQPDEKLTRACELSASDPREARRILDHPPGNYSVTSLTTPDGSYVVRLDPESGRLLTHKCQRLINEPQAFCAHFVKAFLLWQEEQEQELDRNEWMEVDMDDSTTALAVRDAAPDMQLVPQPALPNRDEWVALGRLAMQLFENGKGSLIPSDVKNWQQVCGLMLYGRELGFDPMTALKHVYMVNGRYELGSHGKRAMIQRVGGDIQYAYGENSVTATLSRPGRPDTVVTYTIDQAKKTPEYERNPNWKQRPEDMLVAAATNRACRRGAADVINAIDWASRRAPTIHDMPTEATDAVWSEDRDGQRQLVDHETGEITGEAPSNESVTESPTASVDTPLESTTLGDRPIQDGPASSATASGTSSSTTPEITPSTGPVADSSPPQTSAHPERHINFVAAFADKAANHKVLSAYQRAIKGMGTLPADYESMSLDEIVEAVGGSWPE